MNQRTFVYSGMGFTEVLTLVFIVLQLTHVIHWPWYEVLGPLIISGGAFVLVVAFGFAMIGIGELLSRRTYRRELRRARIRYAQDSHPSRRRL
jgi:hypothetical protein